VLLFLSYSLVYFENDFHFYPMYTEAEIDNIEQFFKQNGLPDSLQISSHHKINNLPLFVKKTLSVVRMNTGTNVKSHFFIKLVTIKMILEGKINSYGSIYQNLKESPISKLENNRQDKSCKGL